MYEGVLFIFSQTFFENTVFIRVIFALFWPFFLSKNGGAKVMRGNFGRRCFGGDFQVRSGIRCPINKL
jgi:hypothetical protein